MNRFNVVLHICFPLVLEDPTVALVSTFCSHHELLQVIKTGNHRVFKS